jgi:hypothetical protein
MCGKSDLNFCFSFCFYKKNNLFISWLTLFSARLRFRNCVVVAVFRATARARASARACAREREKAPESAKSTRERARARARERHTELSWLLLSQGSQESRVFLHSNSNMPEFGTSNSAQQVLTSLFSDLFSATSVLCLLASIVFFLLLRGRSTRGAAAAAKSRNLRQHDDELQQLSTWGQQLPPGSMGLPLIGETLYYSRSMKTSKPTFMADHRKK